VCENFIVCCKFQEESIDWKIRWERRGETCVIIIIIEKGPNQKTDRWFVAYTLFFSSVEKRRGNFTPGHRYCIGRVRYYTRRILPPPPFLLYITTTPKTLKTVALYRLVCLYSLSFFQNIINWPIQKRWEPKGKKKIRSIQQQQLLVNRLRNLACRGHIN
jgi:hypothetical protein